MVGVRQTMRKKVQDVKRQNTKTTATTKPYEGRIVYTSKFGVQPPCQWWKLPKLFKVPSRWPRCLAVSIPAYTRKFKGSSHSTRETQNLLFSSIYWQRNKRRGWHAPLYLSTLFFSFIVGCFLQQRTLKHKNKEL